MFVLSLCLFGWAEKSRRRNWEKIILTSISRSSLWGGSTASGTFAGWLSELDSMRKISLISVSASCGSERSAVDFSIQQCDISKLHIKHPCLPTCLWFLYPYLYSVYLQHISSEGECPCLNLAHKRVLFFSFFPSKCWTSLYAFISRSKTDPITGAVKNTKYHQL